MTLQARLATAAATLRDLSDGIDAEQLAAPTPCTEFDVRKLLDHVIWATRILTAAAAKQPLPADTDWTADLMDDQWRSRLADGLAGTAAAWDDPAAWAGTTVLGPGTELPATLVGELTFVEFVLHGWDLAKATGRTYDCSPETAAAALEVLQKLYAQTQGLSSLAFGPEIAVDSDADAFDRALGLSGRDPGWTAG
ncbi:TIGR03086 family metal-binding protein [Actinoalloteichus hymeniacidonis]|uniref:TIGR03086 family protein n=1 Tax=Actinoalloteichus hymeniacidonis TaxID=340345 RepID=A0AAC9MZ12_9PSEU|nr:TIGR03086 family metal-binding protein [Actinoalloteichus hymeniacidonis]AOS64948.1 putative TIGR03086 family protein [Actinoalloteichus hymeniacidonis]MBB5906977.1 uncharacterized protein (TIGR03086 family) [Actinoalloteichus hymeniacidonis]